MITYVLVVLFKETQNMYNYHMAFSSRIELQEGICSNIGSDYKHHLDACMGYLPFYSTQSGTLRQQNTRQIVASQMAYVPEFSEFLQKFLKGIPFQDS